MIYINSSALNVQPSSLSEYYIQIQTDQQSINGSMARNRIGQKKVADMEFTIMSPSDYTTVFAYFTTGSGVTYLNDQSKFGIFSFTALPTFSDDAYVQGASLYSPFKVSLRET